MGKIYLEGADNTRDLGGLKTTEGAVIKDKQLIRSNRLSRITQKDKILLETEYHLQKILDLRTPMEVEQEPDLEVAGAVYENIPFFMESMVGVSREQETRKQMLHMEEFPEMSDIYKMMIKEEILQKADLTSSQRDYELKKMVRFYGIVQKEKTVVDCYQQPFYFCLMCLKMT